MNNLKKYGHNPLSGKFSFNSKYVNSIRENKTCDYTPKNNEQYNSLVNRDIEINKSDNKTKVAIAAMATTITSAYAIYKIIKESKQKKKLSKTDNEQTKIED